ncbi:Uncharacterized protein dnm_000690 [Desulfonema magnum]|uniref:Uncharacterized protein n=1 Tax=Desulfonema magnum TaxID=45655 RepID=A0A975BET6_9BACT|nr:Uncharacterized protein dnm_000690 [Desulfonema magnum]
MQYILPSDPESKNKFFTMKIYLENPGFLSVFTQYRSA